MATTEDIRAILSRLIDATYGIEYVSAVDTAVKAIGGLIVDAQASEAELVREGERRAQRALQARVTAFERGSVWD